MSAPRHIIAPSMSPEGGSAQIDSAATARKSKLADRMQNQETLSTPVLLGSMFDAAPEFSSKPVDLPQYGVVDRTKRKIHRPTDTIRDQLAEFISDWTLKVVDEHGVKKNSGQIDKVIVELYRTMTGSFTNTEVVTTSTIANKGIIPDGISLDFENMKKNPAQIQQMLHTLRSLELYMTAIIGMEITPYVIDKKNIDTSTLGRINQRLRSGTGLVEKGVDFLFSAPGATLEKIDHQFRDAREFERMRKELAEMFKNGASGLDVGAAGFEEFLNLGRDQGIIEQRKKILELRQLRISMLKHLAPGRPPDSLGTDVTKKLDEVLMRDEYKEYRDKGMSYPDLPEHVRMYVEAEAQELVLLDKATDKGEELWESYMFQTFEGSEEKRKRHSSLQNRINELTGGPSTEQKVIDEKKAAYDSAQKSWDDKSGEIADFQTEINTLQKSLPILGQQYKNAKSAYDNFTSGAVTFTGTAQEKKVREQTLYTEMQGHLDKIIEAQKTLEDKTKNLRKAKRDRKDLGKTKDKAYSEYKPYKGKSAQDKEKIALLEAIQKIVKSDGERNDLVWHILRDIDPASLFRSEETLFTDNYNTLRRLFGIRGEEFKDIVGNDNINLRLFLARTLNIEFDESTIKKAAVGSSDREELDKKIWEAIRRNSKSDLAKMAIHTWDVLFITAVDKDIATLDYRDVFQKPEIIGPKPAEIVGEVSRREMQRVLEKQGYFSGVNTLAKFTKLSNGEVVAIAVDENGRNVVIDSSGTNLGSMERIVNAKYEPATMESAAKIQSIIEEELGEKSILFYFVDTVTPNKKKYTTLGIRQFTKTHYDIFLKKVGDDWTVEGVGTGGIDMALAEYLKTDQGMLLAKEAALRYIQRMEKLSLDMRENQAEIGLPQEVAMDRDRMGLEWEDSKSYNPATREHHSMRVILGEEDHPLVSRNKFFRHIESKKIAGINTPTIVTPVESVEYSPYRSLEGPIDATMRGQKKRLLEAGFNVVAMSTETERQKFSSFMHNVRIDGLSTSGSHIYEVTMDDQGNMLLFDRSAKDTLAEESHNAMDYLNEQIVSGNLSLNDARKIRQAIGMEYFKAMNRLYRSK